MATITATSLENIETIKVDKDSGINLALVTFRLSGTYAQADNAQLQGLPALISARRRNGKTVSLLTAMPGLNATKASDPSAAMYLSGVAIAGSDINFAVTDSDLTTEIANGVLPSQEAPFSLLVTFKES